jgi:two-component system LytT family response regulator
MRAHIVGEQTVREALRELPEAGHASPAAVTDSGAADMEKVAASLQEVLAAQQTRSSPPPRLIGERSNRLYFIEVDAVDYIEAYGNYVRIHVGNQEYVRRDTIKRLALELRGAGFEWVHRSTLLNLRRVAFAERFGEGALAFTLTCGARLLSRTRFRLDPASKMPSRRFRGRAAIV